MSAEEQLKALVQACEIMRDGGGFHRLSHSHCVSPPTWSAWCKQIQFAKQYMKWKDDLLNERH